MNIKTVKFLVSMFGYWAKLSIIINIIPHKVVTVFYGILVELNFYRLLGSFILNLINIMESLFIEFLPRSKMGMITPICGNNYMLI